jgi:ribose/xylose/arabinose/galactoside ABC-type transport system permease subunit
MTILMNRPSAQIGEDVQPQDSLEIRALVFIRDRGIIVLWIVLIIAFSIWARPFFGTWDNAVLIANAAAVAAVYAAGVGVGVMSGALDISIPGVAALAGVVCGKLLTNGGSVSLGIVAALLVGIVVGVINGLIALRGYNPLIITIGTLSVTSGVAAVVSGGYAIPGLTQLTFMGTDRYLGLPAPVWIVFVLYAVLTLFITQTRHGLRFMAVGGNMEAVRRSGINSSVYRVLGFVIGGLCAALGGVVSVAVSTEANPDASPGIIFTALTAVALSGVALTGGRGSLPRVLVGALILATIGNALTIKGVQPYWSTIVTGLLLLFALGMESSVKTAVERRLVKAAAASAHSGRQ